MFDLTTIAVSDTAAVSLKGPSGKPLADAKGKAVTVTLHSPSSDACVAADDARTERMIERRERKGDVRMTGAELRAEQAQYLADRTASIDNLAYPTGR